MAKPVLFLALALALSGCGASAAVTPPGGQETPPATRPPAIQEVPPTMTPADDALRQDAEALARDLGITPEEALRRLQLQPAAGELDAALAEAEPDTFAGLWIEHEPAYRVVAAFTRDGEATIRPYVAGTPLEGVVEVRAAALSLAELRAAQAEAGRRLKAIGLAFDSSVNLRANQVELYVTDRQLLERSLAQAGLALPDHVAVVTIYEPAGAAPPVPLTPVPGLALPQLRVRSGAFMAALLQGTLVAHDGCLRVSPGDGAPGHLILWQPDYYLTDSGGTPAILDRTGAVVARVGEPIQVGGGEVPFTDDLAAQLQSPVPPECGGPYWLMGELLAP